MDFYKHKEVFDGLDEGDLGRYYTKCLLPLKKCSNGKILIVSIERMDANHSIIHRAGGKMETIENKDYEWPMGFNWTGYLNFDKFSVYAMRGAKRQWRKGLTRNNTITVIRFQETLQRYFVGYRDLAVVRQDINVLMKPLQELVDKGVRGYYPAYKDAYNKIASGKAGSVAVTPEFTIALDEMADSPYLLKRETIVGRAHSDHVLLDAGHKQLWPQITFTEARGV